MIDKLTKKCKCDFITWMCKNYPDIKWHEYETMQECMLNALIIKFFDSVKYKGGSFWTYNFEFFWKYKSDFQSFNDVCIQSMQQANEFYNKKIN